MMWRTAWTRLVLPITRLFDFAPASPDSHCIESGSHSPRSHTRGTAAVFDGFGDDVAAVFTSVFWRHKLAQEKSEALALQCKAIHRLWSAMCALVEVQNAHTHSWDLNGEWGFAQVDRPTKQSDNHAVTSDTAVDTPMILDPIIRRRLRFLDWNNLVRDPISEDDALRNRLIWTSEEQEKSPVSQDRSSLAQQVSEGYN
jgi:hypothetical protein